MKRMRLSIRLRLTLWNASVLALLLVAFAYGGWLTLAYALRQHAEDRVVETAKAVAAAVIAERNAARARGEPVRGIPDREALRGLRAGDLDIVIADDAARVVAAARARRPLPGRNGRAAPPRDSTTVAPPVRAMMREAQTGSVLGVRTLLLDDGPRRATALRVAPGKEDTEPALLVAVLLSTEDDEALLARVRNGLLFAIPLALTMSVLAGYALARRSLAPVEAMAQQASRISAANLDSRLPVVNAHDELGRLATVVNELLARVNDAFQRQRLFVAEASHELRTPIAIMRGEADVTLQRTTREESEYRESLCVIRDEAVRLTHIVDDLFLLASADAGAPLTAHERIDLDELVQNALRSVRSIADARGITLVATTGNAAPLVEGDRILLRRLVLNLLDNALKHATQGGRIEVSTERHGDHAELVVTDDGPGIPPELRERVFDRFVRGSLDRAGYHGDGTEMNGNGRSSVSSGAGLGLAIASAIAVVHRGKLILGEVDHGASFRLVLPAA